MIEEILETIYESAKGVGLGHFVWYPVANLEAVPRILEVDRASSTEHYATKFQIVQVDHSHFRDRQKLPIKLLSLGNTEELLIAKAKRRPCVVVCIGNTVFSDSEAIKEAKTRTHLQDQSMLVAPIYGLATPQDPRGFPPLMAARVRALLYSQFFYLPKICPKSNLALPKEGIVRLDRMIPALQSRGMEPMDMKLAVEPLKLLMALLRERFGGAEDQNLKTVREILFDALPANARPVAAI